MNKVGIIGIFLITISTLHWLIPFNSLSLSTFHLIFMVGNILLFDYLSFKFSSFSLINFSFGKVANFTRLLFVLITFVVFLEFYAHWLGKTWYFPYFDLPTYILIELPLLVVYSFYLLETFYGTRAIYLKVFKLRSNYNTKLHFPAYLGIIGILGILSGTIYLFATSSTTNLEQFFSVNFAPEVSQNVVYILLIIAVSLWLILEYLNYQKSKKTLFLDMINGNFSEAVIIFIAGVGSAFFYEVFNVSAGFWKYTNLPLQNLTILEVPILIYLFWPVQYFLLLSLYRLFFSKEK